jgi:hypothetical protein
MSYQIIYFCAKCGGPERQTDKFYSVCQVDGLCASHFYNKSCYVSAADKSCGGCKSQFSCDKALNILVTTFMKRKTFTDHEIFILDCLKVELKTGRMTGGDF